MKSPHPSYPIDGSGIYFLAQMARDHTNVYRFCVTLKEPVVPELLQQAADRICPRFPTILAAFRPDLFSYQVIPAVQPPQVRRDPGLLHTMSMEELQHCSYRIYYEGCQIIMEAFHALTDGFGAMASLRALLGEYLYLRHGTTSPERNTLLLEAPDWQEELTDAYPLHTGKSIASLPNLHAYRLPGGTPSDPMYASLLQVSTQSLLNASRACGVSMTTLLAGLLAEAIMDLQEQQPHLSKKMPVRIMVPVDLRRQFPSKTLRNFILYALPTLRPEDAKLPRQQRLLDFQEQLRKETDKNFLAAQITRNVKIQSNPIFRGLPRQWKCALMRLSNHLFGECNSSITLTNLGQMALSEELRQHIRWIEVHLTPRRQSPYNCGLLSTGDITSISLSRFGPQTELETLFFSKIRRLPGIEIYRET